jgi:hypothetical protein
MKDIFMNEIKEFWYSLNKFYFCNFVLVTSLLMSIVLAFTIQFKTESLQDQMAQTEEQISFYRDQISLLEVEWTYQTRPERLRDLSARYLKDNGYTLASQIKNGETMERYYSANYQRDLAANVNHENKLSF